MRQRTHEINIFYHASLPDVPFGSGPLRAAESEILSVKEIWDRGQHNAFTDLIRFRDQWWCTFREGKDHGPSIGKARVIVSKDGDDWTSAAFVEEDGVDLRDPKLSVTPDGPPYTDWSWTKMKENIGGPNFIRLPDDSLWTGGRRYGDKPTTVLARMTRAS